MLLRPAEDRRFCLDNAEALSVLRAVVDLKTYVHGIIVDCLIFFLRAAKLLHFFPISKFFKQKIATGAKFAPIATTYHNHTNAGLSLFDKGTTLYT